MPLFKGLIPGFCLTFIVAMILGSNGVSGDWLEVHRVAIEGYRFYWSWPLFIASTGLATSIFWMME